MDKDSIISENVKMSSSNTPLATSAPTFSCPSAELTDSTTKTNVTVLAKETVKNTQKEAVQSPTTQNALPVPDK
jgi:hypothetical protein